MTPGPFPLVPSTVIVQGQGMERWIAQSVAREAGVCANTAFLYPRNLLERVFSLSEGEAEAAGSGPLAAPSPGWEPTQLAWVIAKQLADHAEAPELAPLARQLGAPDRNWRIVQLADQLASLFDDYITYRPDWVRRWAGDDATSRNESLLGEDEAWQSWLFARVRAALGPGHLADRAAAFSAAVRDAGAHPESALANRMRKAFPRGFEVFAVSTLPPLYLSLIDDLAQLVDVHLSVLSPSRHFWADLWKEIKDEGAVEPATGAEDRITSAERLLAGLGRLGSDFQQALENVSGYVELEGDRFEAPGPSGSILERIQSGFLELEPASADPIAPFDPSVQVHLCHGPKREIEAVKAAITQALDRDPSLRPEDVLVMAPQIDAWVPAIEAVFGAAAEGRGEQSGPSGPPSRIDASPPIPYRIADRGTLRRSPVAEAFAALLAGLGSRWGRSELLDWLAAEPVRAKLGLSAEDAVRLGDWAAEAGIRFGLDEHHREMLGVGADRSHTWAGGLDRGLLGHAVGFDAEVFADLTAAPLPEMLEPALLGAVGDLLETLSAAQREVARPRSVGAWRVVLTELLEETLIAREANAHEHQLVRSALAQIASAAETAGFETEIPFEAIRERFMKALESSRPAQGFLAGGMTFCELVPLRAIPFRCIAIVGLGDTDFPRRRPPASYDLMARHPRAGDRTPRSDDRTLFLEAILSARDQLILTVPAKDLRDGEDQPPSVVVSELLDMIDTYLGDAPRSTQGAGERVRDQIVFEHALQSFSPAYFEPDHKLAWLALDAASFEGAMARRSALSGAGPSAAAFLEVLPAPEDAAAKRPTMTLASLQERLLDSTRYFARQRLGLRMPRPGESLSDFDPSEVGSLDGSQLGAAVLDDLRAGDRPEAARQRLLASPLLPVGEAGRIGADALRIEAQQLAILAQEREAALGGEAPPFDFSFSVVFDGASLVERTDLPSDWLPAEGLELTGILTQLRAGGRFEASFARLGGRAELDRWIEHLVLCTLAETGALADAGVSVQAQSVLVGRSEDRKKSESVVLFGPVPEAKRELARLCALAWAADRAPLPLFRKTSRVFAAGLAKGGPEQAWRNANQSFYGGEGGFRRAEIEDHLEFQKVWEGQRPLESAPSNPFPFDFEDLAQYFFEPLFRARTVSRR